MTPARALALSKHEGAGNDFLVLLDPTDERSLDGATVRALCARHQGVGADGVIRVGPGRRRGRGLDGTAQRRRECGRDERERHSLPGPGGGRRRPGVAPDLCCGHRSRRQDRDLRARRTARPSPGVRGHGAGDPPRRDGTVGRSGAGPTGRRRQPPPGAARRWPGRARADGPRPRHRRPGPGGPVPGRDQRGVDRPRPGARRVERCGSGSGEPARPWPVGPGAVRRRRPPPPGAWSAGGWPCTTRAAPSRSPSRPRPSEPVDLAGPVRKVADITVDLDRIR